MSSDQPPRPNPYIGPRPFEPGEKLYGRERETRELLDLLIAERIVLLHSPSGAGKTSLLQAALIPRLQQRRFNVLPIMRVNRPSKDLPAANRYVLSALSSLEDALPEPQRLPGQTLTSLTLDDYLQQRAAQFGAQNSQLLIFDQFEEALNVDPTDRAAKEAFFAQLGTALLDRRRWALFAIREDYMGGLAPYLRPLPTQLSNTFRLDLLDVQAALQAIQRPARDAGVDFTDAAASKLVDDLRRVQSQQPDGTVTTQLGLYVEPVQLQVVCLRLAQKKALVPGATITESDLSAVGGVDAALAGYYADSVKRIAAQTQTPERLIREWFDEQLITAQGIRAQVLREPAHSGSLANTVVEALENAHLVRAEARRGETWYELAHDRLIDPVRQNDAEWFTANLSTLQRQAKLWDENHRQAGFLLNRQALNDVEQSAGANGDALNAVEQDFLRESREAEAQAAREQAVKEQEQQLKSERAILQVEQSKNARIRQLAIGAILVSLLALGALLGVVVLNAQVVGAQRQAVDAQSTAVAEASNAVAAKSTAVAEADRALSAQATAEAERGRAEQQTHISSSRRLTIQSASNRDTQFDLSLLLGVEALRLDSNVEARSNLLDALNSAPQLSAFLSGHTGPVYGVALSPDGRILASAAGDHTIRLWDMAARGAIGAPLSGHADAVINVDFSPDGKLLASSSADHTIRLWDVASRTAIGQPLAGHGDSVIDVRFSPDGKTLASSSDDHTIRLWDVATHNPIGRPLSLDTAVAYGLAFSPDGGILAAGSIDHTIRLWSIAALIRAGADAGRPAGAALAGHTDTVYAVAFSPDGKMLASASADNTIRLWDFSAAFNPSVESRALQGQPLLGHTGTVYSVAFSPDGKRLVSASADHTVRLWDVASRQPLDPPLTGHTDTVYAALFSRDGRTLVSGSADYTVRLWDTNARQASGQALSGHTSGVLGVAFSPDGKLLASGAGDKTVRLWDVQTRQAAGQPLTGHSGIVYSVAFSPDGRLLASGSADRTVLLWDVAARRIVGQPLTSGDTVLAVAFSPDGKTLASVGGENTLRLWDVATHQLLAAPLAAHTGSVLSVAFSRDGKLLATAGLDYSIRLWDLALRQALQGPLLGHSDVVQSVAFSPDGKTLASGSADRTIRFWDVASHQKVGQPLSGHLDFVDSVAFSPDGKTLASGSGDKTIRLWDVGSRQPFGQPLEGHTFVVHTVVFSPDGKTLASASLDKTVRLWDVDQQALPDRACRVANRNLTRAEWAQYIDADPSTYRATCPDMPLEPQ